MVSVEDPQPHQTISALHAKASTASLRQAIRRAGSIAGNVQKGAVKNIVAAAPLRPEAGWDGGLAG